MKSRIKFTLLITLFGLMISSSRAGFTSIHVFGDSLSCTTNNPSAGPHYYGQRYSNGRVWVEALAIQQGLTLSPDQNNSFYGNYSTNVVKTVKAFTAPPDSNTCVVVVWVNNADLFDLALYTDTTLASWTSAIAKSQTNHYQIITNLYSKGIRNLIMPNTVDLSTIPKCNHSSGGYTNVIRQQCAAYNVAFSNTLNRARAACPGLMIYSPDYYSLLGDLLAHPASYGVTNALKNYNGIITSVDAIQALVNPPLPTPPGSDYIFWDQFNPSAKVHYIMACLAQQMISPVQISQIATFDSSNRLDVINIPLGANCICMVESCSNLLAKSWVTNTSFTGTSPQQSVFVSKADPTTTSQPQVRPKIPGLPDGNPGILVDFRLYRLEFPYNWVWP